MIQKFIQLSEKWSHLQQHSHSNICLSFLKSFPLSSITKEFFFTISERWLILSYIHIYISINTMELFICEKSSHPGETSHLSGIAAGWYISLCKNKSFIWELIHPTQVRSHLNIDEISLRWDYFSPCKQFLPDCPT